MIDLLAGMITGIVAIFAFEEFVLGHADKRAKRDRQRVAKWVDERIKSKNTPG